jgi:PAS domain-containing protein
MPESLPSPVPSDAESARFRILEPLRAAQEQLARVQDAAGIGVFTLDLREGVLHPSPAFCRLHGLEVRERYALAALAERFPAEDTAIPSGTSSEEAVYRVRDSRTGASRWIARTLEIERDADGAALRLAGVVRDVTEQRAQGTALAESEQHYRTLFEQMDEGYSVIEFIDGPHGPLSDYVHVTANRAYAQHAGIENVAGKRLREIVGEEAESWSPPGATSNSPLSASSRRRGGRSRCCSRTSRPGGAWSTCSIPRLPTWRRRWWRNGATATASGRSRRSSRSWPPPTGGSRR